MAHNHASHHHADEHECVCGGDCGGHEHTMARTDKTVIVETATALSEKEQGSMKELVTQIAKQQLPVTFKVNEQLLGGFAIQIGDRKIDVSLKSELNQMIHTLKGTNHGK